MMNERLRELKKKAMCSDGREGLAGPYMVLDEDLFAELIVRECANIADKVPGEYLLQPCKYPSTFIKEHFGVEE